MKAILRYALGQGYRGQFGLSKGAAALFLMTRKKTTSPSQSTTLQGTPVRNENTAGEVIQSKDYSLLSLSQNKETEKKKQRQGVFLDGQQGEVFLG